MISKKTFCYKASAKLHRRLVINAKSKSIYYWLYASYWHSKLVKADRQADVTQYMSARPNPGAGIGHQIANWLSGYQIAKYYSLRYATYPFSDLSNPLNANEWDSFLGLNTGEISVESLLKSGYKKILLPQIDYQSSEERNLLNDIITSYRGEKVVFLLEMDQFAGSELENLDFMREKYWSSKARLNDELVFQKEHFNVAVHIRRGDIVQKGEKKNDNLTMRWLDIDYYQEMLQKYLYYYAGERQIDIYLFSQADEKELQGFDKFGTVYFCNKMDAVKSFLHMVNADMLIMSRSGMSYQAAKLNRDGIICFPEGFWREPVESDKWINVPTHVQ